MKELNVERSEILQGGKGIKDVRDAFQGFPFGIASANTELRKTVRADRQLIDFPEAAAGTFAAWQGAKKVR
jgi:hypothetical protein